MSPAAWLRIAGTKSCSIPSANGFLSSGAHRYDRSPVTPETQAIPSPNEDATSHVQVPPVAVLIDYDNLYSDEHENEAAVGVFLNRLLNHALELETATRRIELRLYGGWLEEEVMTKRASVLQSNLGSNPIFPLPHPGGVGLLRGRVELVTRLADGPEMTWAHTLRRRMGLPRVSLTQRPHPAGCQHQSGECPVLKLHRFARRPTRTCAVAGCTVTNHAAFSVPEQKMVDVLIACDAISYAQMGYSVMVGSSDLDILPAVALASSRATGSVALLRVVDDSAGLYERELADLGVELRSWDSM